MERVNNTMSEYKISRLHLKNYKLFSDKEIDFCEADVFVLDGPNGYGKTSVFEAIEYLLTGSIKRAEESPELSGRIAYKSHFLAKDSAKMVIVEGTFVADNEKLQIIRKIDISSLTGVNNNPKNLKAVTDTKIIQNGNCIFDGKAEKANPKIGKIMGTNILNYYDKFYFISQEDRLKFLTGSEQDRMKEMSSLFNIDNEINQHNKINRMKTRLTQLINKNKKHNETERAEYERQKKELSAAVKEYLPYVDIFPKASNKPYWNGQNIKFVNKDRLNEIIEELNNMTKFTRYIDYFRKSFRNSILDSYLQDITLLKKCFLMLWINDNIKKCEEENSLYRFLKELPVKNNNDDFDIEQVNIRLLKEKLNIDVEISDLVELQQEICERRKNQSIYDKSLEKFKNARNNLKISLEQWNKNKGEHFEESKCPYCGTIFDEKAVYEKAINDVAKILQDCSSVEADKINKRVTLLERKFNDKFEKIIRSYIENHAYFELMEIKDIFDDVSKATIDFNKFNKFFTTILFPLKKYILNPENADKWDRLLQECVEEIKVHYIQEVPESYKVLEHECDFFGIFKKIYEKKFDAVTSITEEDKRRKRLYLEEQYQLQEYDKLKEKENRLKINEKLVDDLVQMQKKIEKVAKVYKEQIGKYQKKVIGEIQIPLYIYSGRVLQYYQGGLGVFIQYDRKNEKLDTIRFLASKQNEHDILYTLSSGQLTGIIIALTLVLNKIYGNSGLKCILIDDPVQTMDDLNVASLVDLLRNEFRNYQLIVSTHEEDFSRYIRYKYEKYQLKTKRCLLKMQSRHNII